MKTRYKIRKEQLERVVESFVMESAEGKMMVKDAAKKHKMNMGAEQHDDMGDGMKKASVNKKNKMKQAPEVKKNIHGKVSESRMIREAEEEEVKQEVKSVLTDLQKNNPEEFKKLQQLAKAFAKKAEQTQTQDEGFRDSFNKIKVKLGGALIVLGIGSLGAFGRHQEVQEALGHYGVDLSNPLFVAGILSALTGGGIIMSKLSSDAKEIERKKQEKRDAMMKDRNKA